MVTPQEIQEKEFARAVRGYKEDEVDMFLDMITLDLEQIIHEYETLKQENEELKAKMANYQGAENEVSKTLTQAQELMNDISVSAEKRAEIVIKNAELDAELAVREAREKALRIEEQNRDLEMRFRNFSKKYRSLLKDELEHFESASDAMTVGVSPSLEEILAETDDVADEEKKDTLGFLGSEATFVEEDEERRTVIINTGEEF